MSDTAGTVAARMIVNNDPVLTWLENNSSSKEGVRKLVNRITEVIDHLDGQQLFENPQAVAEITAAIRTLKATLPMWPKNMKYADGRIKVIDSSGHLVKILDPNQKGEFDFPRFPIEVYYPGDERTAYYDPETGTLMHINHPSHGAIWVNGGEQ